MAIVTIPQNFDGEKFIDKFNLGIYDFRIDGDQLSCPSLPNLTNSDLLDCIVDFQRIERVKTRLASSKATAEAIPNWADWTQADWLSYFTANLSDAEADLVTSIATARVMIKRQNLVILNLVKMVIAMRDNMWPDLPEDNSA